MLPNSGPANHADSQPRSSSTRTTIVRAATIAWIGLKRTRDNYVTCPMPFGGAEDSDRATTLGYPGIPASQAFQATLMVFTAASTVDLIGSFPSIRMTTGQRLAAAASAS